MLHRIRYILGLDDDNIFDGTTECDEVYLGGKERNKHASKKIRLIISFKNGF